MTLVTANHSQVTGYHPHRLLITILIVALGSLIGIVIAGYHFMSDGQISSYLSGLWTHSDKHIGLSSSSVPTQTELPKTDLAQLRRSVTDNSGQPI
jgi:hypothetical protein